MGGATWDKYGIRLLGMPLGSSPMRPEGCAPTGLKYRNSSTVQSFPGEGEDPPKRKPRHILHRYQSISKKNIRAVQKIKHSVCHNVFVREFTNLKPCLKNAMLRGNHVELWKKEHTVWGCMNIAQNLLNHKLRSVKEVIHWITNTCEPPKMCSGGTNKPTSNIFVSFIFSFCSYGFRLYFTMTFCVVGMRRKETQHKQKNS